ncbi:Pre-mRNA-splicing factor clf1 [Colletotrichum fructicola]|uniref:Pre-mRNA-splicing factor clf1 n=1 Tax=Colletotrichum fructicola (strain Nara gc5) TaxID=1213859 RepID=L2FZH2_COLFN|nr:Pre-mRNA-splicing factor [Colletotrichum fructicola]KAF4477640.1 Pre-mRNA-splicing factor clf1 [Colletotrichum fructicola Nara gc5]KAI8283350.1 Pre-mRNA-splicing factor [Colletotrichum sp. SAR11_57]KAE9570327.1 Pre-mRNA-splicing factor [Colletotrichum fructicola]KAF4414028.1 Pre-mRNA-splicing factor clf1 [Colletotrichum fructicola]KAF4884486.1 Pre-mRNA-splicing factor clf1 [Colletotrichum fructicola]
MEASRGPPKVKNKAPAPVQISAEQLLREAVDRQEVALQAPTQRFADLEELHEFQGRKRREFEDYVRRNRVNLNNWMRYAQWELEQKEFRRARSIFERALDVHPNSVPLWIRYCESEMKNGDISHARNLFDRAVARLPRVDKLWYKYVYMEEMLGEIPKTRSVFDRWMQWQPDEAAWSAYIKLEKRYGEYDRARDIFEKFTQVHPEPRNWIKWARFEEEFGTSDMVREVYGIAVEALGDDFVDEKLFVSYARFEAKMKEYERARAIYKYAMDRLPRSKSMALHKAYTTFEKQFGDRDGVEDVVLSKRRVFYENQVKENPKNYDTWFDYTRLEETAGDLDRVRDVYERAVAQVPPAQEKRFWRRYIYLWINYAIFEELQAKDVERARQIYKVCLELIPHKKFTFAKIWLLKAQFEIRQGELTSARKTLGQAIGMCPKDKLFRGYIELELKLFEFLRCRTLYEKHIEWNPANCQTWIKFAELERGLDDLDRTRAIFELAVNQMVLDMPELLWKAYIDFEEEEGEYDRTRELYERLLEKTDHVKVWISYAHFELNIPEDEEAEEEEAPISDVAKARARKVFERAHKSMREKDLKEESVTLLNAWLSFERMHGAEDNVEKVQKLMPRKTKRRRRLEDDSFEEYIDYVFPADDKQSQNLSNLLAMAQAWKQQAADATT